MVLVRRNAVDLVVAGHDRQGTRLAQGGFEGREEHLAQHARRGDGRCGVAPALGVAVPGHVFERGHDVHSINGRVGRGAPALEAVHRCDAHARDEIGILAIGLLDAAPARVASHVDHRSQHVLNPACPHLARGHGEDFLGQRGVKTRRQGDGLGKAGGARCDETVQAFFVQDGRDAKARFLNQELLQGVRHVRGLARGVLVARAGDFAHAVGHQLARPSDREELRLGIVDEGVVPVDRLKLRYLLVDRHAAEQVGDTHVDGKLGVAVGGLARRFPFRQHSGAGQGRDDNQEGRGASQSHGYGICQAYLGWS